MLEAHTTFRREIPIPLGGGGLTRPAWIECQQTLECRKQPPSTRPEDTGEIPDLYESKHEVRTHCAFTTQP